MANEVNWERLDKRRFFTIGVGLFSGITTVLYPLSVVKTRQMAAEGVSGGLSGTKAVAATIWRQDGLRGFYRGFGTVVFGTIPARVVYLTTLEVTKSGFTKVGEQLNLAPATLAATSSFIAGGAASLSTQAVVVPIDVVSQRLMMQGVETNHTITTTSSSSSSRPPAPAGASSNPASSSSSPGTSPAARAAAAPAGGSAAPQPQEQQRRGFSTQSGQRMASSSSIGSSGGAGPGPGSRPQPAPAGHSGCSSSISSSRRFGSSSYVHYVHAQCSTQHSIHPYPGSLSAAAVAAGPQQASQSLGFRRRLATATAAAPSNGWQMARHIVAEEGVGGLYRGFLPSVATFVPSSAVWWGAYGFWQKVIWMQLLGEDTTHPHHHQQQQQKGASPGAADTTAAKDGSSSSTGRVVGVQVASSLLAGCTAALTTNPLDLVKTRMQLAEVSAGGVAPSWRAVAGALLAEEGGLGMWRGVAPRMVSSACWGTAMVSSYEYLKRICALPPP